MMKTRIRSPFYKFFLNSDYVAARSLRLLRSDEKDKYDFIILGKVKKYSKQKQIYLIF